MQRRVLKETAKGVRLLRREFGQVSAWLETDPPSRWYNLEVPLYFANPERGRPPAQYDEIRHVEAMLYAVLRRLRGLELIEKVKAIDRDILGAYFFHDIPIVELYWMVIALVAGLTGVSVEALTVVVLMHELAHAYSHLGRDIDGNRWDISDFQHAERAVTEGLAQFYTASICSKLEQRFPIVQRAYENLLALQSGPYRVPEKWLNGKDKDRAGEVVRMSMIRCRSTGMTKLVDFESVRGLYCRGLTRPVAKPANG
jgi:hypothetical protein